LPAPWVKENGVKQGDELNIEETGEALLVSPQSIHKLLEITEDVSGLAPRLVDRLLARTYQKGYDKINLIHNDLKTLNTIREKVSELIGYEIMEQSEKTCLIQAISSRIELDFDNSLRKAFLIVKQMMETGYEAYKKNDLKALANVYLKDMEVNRLCYFCLRQINKKHYVKPDETQQRHILYYLIEVLEDLGDSFKKLCTRLSKVEKNDHFLILLEKLKEQFDTSYSYFYKATKKDANKAFSLYDEINLLVEKLAEECLNKELVLSLGLVKESTHIIYHYTTMRLDFLKENN